MAGELLDAAGMKNVDFMLESCDVGGNNRVYTITTDSGKFLAK